MAKRKWLSAVMLETELVTAEDVERALSHQREHGGYFGEALVALGLVRSEEVEWALANQLDLPFVFPDADAADPQATSLVPADWALAHLAVPLVRTADSVRVVVADPLDQHVVEALRRRSGLEVEMALATPERIRELIRAVYGRSEPGTAAREAPTSLGEFVGDALARGADRIGVSARGGRALGWFTVGETRERRRLEDGWEADLAGLLDPSPEPLRRADSGEAEGPGSPPFQATLRQPGGDVPVEVRWVATLSGTELLLRPRRARPSDPGPGLDEGVVADLRLLAAEGARIGVAGSGEYVDGALPWLPSMVLGEDARAAHVAEDADVPGVYTMPATDAPGLASLLEAYAFDALTVDLPLDDERLPAILATAPLAFVRVPDIAGPAALERAGIGWLLTVSGAGPEGRAWELRPANR